jgi:hypothetical protein
MDLPVEVDEGLGLDRRLAQGQPTSNRRPGFSFRNVIERLARAFTGAVLVLGGLFVFGLAYLIFIWGLSQQVGVYPEELGWVAAGAFSFPCVAVSLLVAIGVWTGND